MATKKEINERCPLQSECGRKKCEFKFKEAECNYYIGNSRPGYEIPDQEKSDTSIWDDAAETTDVAVGLTYIPIDELYPHPDNPRKDLGDLTELADSIKVKGVLQNLTVIPGHRLTKEEWIETAKKEGVSKSDALGTYEATFVPDGYTILIGHRRMAAAKLAGLTELPCAITDMPPSEQVATMLLENMQRNDLTVYEQAKGFQLMLDFGDTIETVAEKSGFSQTTVRRRIRLLELDESKFKKSESRGATLFEYMELDKIKDIDLKNKVLDTIGTANFNNELKKAIEQEETKEYFDNVEAEVSKFATKTDDCSGYSYVTEFSPWRKKEVVAPDDADTVKYYYKRNNNYISLYKEKVITEAEEEQKRIEAEKAADRDRRKAELKAASERAYELRVEAIDSISNSHALKHLPDIMAFLMKATCDSHYIRIDNADIAEMVGFDTDSEEYENWTDEEFNEHLFALIETKTKDKAAQCLLKYAYALCEDSGNKSYYDWYAMHSTNKKLDRIYDFLCSLGYEMSDEEKALRDGTHELFITEESE